MWSYVSFLLLVMDDQVAQNDDNDFGLQNISPNMPRVTGYIMMPSVIMIRS